MKSLLVFFITINMLLVAKTVNSQTFFVGTYTSKESKGIYTYELKEDGSIDSIGLAAETTNPSFLAKTYDGKYLVAVSEVSSKVKTGGVASFLINGPKLEHINTSFSGGEHPCFVAVNEQGYVLVANYTGGNVGLLKLDEKGVLSELLDLQQHIGRGTTSRQEGPHAHSAWFTPDGKGVIAVDLGTNELWFYDLDKEAEKLNPSMQPKLAMHEGAGPRHLAFHPNGKWIYVLNELDGTVTLVEYSEKEGYRILDTVSCLPKKAGQNKSADIHISPDGRYVYASNRGHNSIAIFKVEKTSGKLLIKDFKTYEINWPRNFAISPDGKYLLVANRNDNSISTYLRPKRRGRLGFIQKVYVPEPVCIVF